VEIQVLRRNEVRVNIRRRLQEQRSVLFLLAALVLLAAVGRLLVPREPDLAKPPVPEVGVLLGAYLPPSEPGRVAPDVAVASLETEVGATFRIDQHFYDFGDPFPGWQEDLDRQHGRIPLITWQTKKLSLDRIRSGAYDRTIEARARELKRFGAPVFLRWAPEMNGDGHPQGVTPDRAASLYVSAWRRIHGVFQRVGADNVAWVWCPNHEDVPRGAWNHWTGYYPGDRYVDWVGVDGYNFDSSTSGPGGTKRRPHDLTDIVAGVYNDYAHKKPIMIAETSSEDFSGERPQWIDNVRILLKDRLPQVKALVWFDKPPRWQVEDEQRSLAAFRRLVADPYFLVHRAAPSSRASPPRSAAAPG
jgi:hypothetical protein